MEPYEVLPLQVRVELGVMAMKVYSTFPQSSMTGASPFDSLLSYPGCVSEEVFPLCRDTLSVFYTPSQLGYKFGLVETN